MYIHILIKTQHPTNLIISCIVCLWGKREKSFIHIFLAFSQEIWTKENKIINKLCGGVKMVCICLYTPDDAPFWKDTHCVLGLDDNGKVGACGWNHLQRVDQFLLAVYVTRKSSLTSRTLWPNPKISSLDSCKHVPIKSLFFARNAVLYRPRFQDGPLQYSNLETQASIKQLSSLGVNVKWNEKLNFAIQVIQGQCLLYDLSISSHLVAKPNSQESKPFKQIKQWKIQVITLDMHAYK